MIGLFSLGGVLLGGLLSPVTQLFLEWNRERRTAHRAKLLIAAELLHAQVTLRVVAKMGKWPAGEDMDVYLPTSAWREHRASIAGKVSENILWDLVMTYSLLEHDRERFAMANKIGAPFPLGAELAKDMKAESNRIGDLRRKLGLGGGWEDEIEDKYREALKQLETKVSQ